MKTNLRYREQLRAIGAFLLDELDTLIGVLQGSWAVEHTDDDRHGHVHATTLQVGRVSFSNILSTAITTAQVDDFNDSRLRDAGVWRVTITGVGIASLTSIQAPLDENGTPLDGRILAIENASDKAILSLEHQHTGGSPANRFDIPWRPASVTGATNRHFIPPGGIGLVQYSSAVARWRVISQHNDEILSYAEFGSNQNDFAPANFRAARVVRLVPTAAGLTVSGFASTDLQAPCRKTIINEGVYRFAILHMNTGSSAANRVQCPAGSMYYLHPRESVDIYFETDGTWHIILKADQWVDVAYNASDYTTDSAAVWTVDGADIATLMYQIDGNKMIVAFEILSSDLSAGTQQLRIPIPAGRVSAREVQIPIRVLDAGVAGIGFARVTAGGTTIDFFKDAAAANWTATAGDNTYVIGEIAFMVQTSCATVSEPHSDVAHSDTAHGDGGHADVAHVDGAHVDAHSDTAHSDAAHGDTAHSDVAHSDTAHSDVTHEDTHSDGAHDDVAHVDVAHDDGHSDAHADFTDGAGHGDSHSDQHFDTAHSDTAHADAAHADAHSDAAHSDVAHVDTAHADTAHADSGHSDTAHADTHSDTPHADTAHTDSAHTDTVHADTPHLDVGLHCDTAHADM